MADLPKGLINKLLSLDACGRCGDDMLFSQYDVPRQSVRNIVKELW